MVYDPRGRTAVVVLDNLPPLALGQVYQLWLLRPDAPPTSAGTLAPDAVGTSGAVVRAGNELGLYNGAAVTSGAGPRPGRPQRALRRPHLSLAARCPLTPPEHPTGPPPAPHRRTGPHGMLPPERGQQCQESREGHWSPDWSEYGSRRWRHRAGPDRRPRSAQPHRGTRVMGASTLAVQGGQTAVVVRITGAPANSTHVNHIHTGSCEAEGASPTPSPICAPTPRVRAWP